MLLAVTALAISLALGSPAPGPTQSATPTSHLPATQPGAGRNEGVFLITTADDGTRAVYFVAGNTRHSILPADMQLELQLNALWPLRYVDTDEVLALAEGAPIGAARMGLVGAPEPEQPAPTAADGALDQPAPVAADVPLEQPAPVAAEVPLEQPATYVVRPGDSAIGIARQFGIPQRALLAANGISNPNRVYIGQVLTIPSS